MKIKLYGTSTTEPLNLTLLNGGYDAESGRVVLMVRNDEQSGTLALDVNEARKLATILTTGIPDVKMVEAPVLTAKGVTVDARAI